MIEQMNGWMDGWMDGRRRHWIIRQANECIDRQTYVGR